VTADRVPGNHRTDPNCFVRHSHVMKQYTCCASFGSYMSCCGSRICHRFQMALPSYCSSFSISTFADRLLRLKTRAPETRRKISNRYTHPNNRLPGLEVRTNTQAPHLASDMFLFFSHVRRCLGRPISTLFFFLLRGHRKSQSSCIFR